MPDTQTTDAPALPAGAVRLPPDKKHPDGGWVILRDPEELTGRHTKLILSAVIAGSSGSTALMQMRLATLELMVMNWSYDDLPLPATDAVTDHLGAAALGVLLNLVEPARRMALGLDVAPVMDEVTIADPASPTPGSSESKAA